MEEAFRQAGEVLEDTNDKERYGQTLQTLCQHAETTFQQLVETYCGVAQVPIPLAFHKAVLKFGLRALDANKHEEVELFLMRDEKGTIA